MSDRIEQLKKFIAEDPDDPFNHYALALEYVKMDEPQAIAILKDLIKNHRNYLPIYYQLGKLYQRMRQKENAIQIFNEGISIARQQNDLKTLRELTAGLEELFEDE